jgi:hypothetical protein
MMDIFEYWFLDSAIEEVIVCNWIIPDEHGVIHLNRINHGLSFEETAIVLNRLFRQGDLLAGFGSDFDDVTYYPINGFTPSLEETIDALENKLYMCYFLTQQGGNRWESASSPNWNKFFVGFTGSEESDLYSANRDLLAEYLKVCHLISYGSSRYLPISETVIWEELSPWNATYWKSFPLGYRLRFKRRITEIELSELSEEIHEREKLVNEWHRNTRKWYTNYFKSTKS